MSVVEVDELLFSERLEPELRLELEIELVLELELEPEFDNEETDPEPSNAVQELFLLKFRFKEDE